MNRPLSRLSNGFIHEKMESALSESLFDLEQIKTDRIYHQIIDLNQWAKFMEKHPLLIELCQTPQFQRLKNIYQWGITAYLAKYQHIGQKITRYEHSLGVSKLAWHFMTRAQWPEKHIVRMIVIALLHDISHTAFSHVADVVFNQSYHEEQRAQYILNSSELMSVLSKLEQCDYLSIKQDILVDASTLLIKAQSPNLNCDRLDYFLRDGFLYNIFTQGEINSILTMVKVPPLKKDGSEQGPLYLINIYWAQLLSIKSIILGNQWNNPNEHLNYCLFAQILKDYLQLTFTNSDIFWNIGDDQFMDLLTQKFSDRIDQIIYNRYISLSYEPDQLDKIGLLNTILIQCQKPKKFRHLDPLILIKNHKYQRVSEISDLKSKKILEMIQSYQSTQTYVATNYSSYIHQHRPKEPEPDKCGKLPIESSSQNLGFRFRATGAL